MKFGHWLGLLGLIAAAVLLWNLRQNLILLFAAVVLAMALCTVVDWVRQKLACSRSLALGLSLVLVLVLVALVATVVIPPFVDEFGQLMAKLPAAASTLIQLVRTAMASASQMLYGQHNADLNWLRDNLSRGTGLSPALPANLGSSALGLLGLASGLGTALLQTLFVVAVALMVALQPTGYREVAVLLVPSFYRRRFRHVLVQCGNLAAMGLSLLGVKLVAANALLAGLLNIIPNLGPTLSTVFPMSVALLDAPWKALAVLALYVAVQNLESYVITPSVMHQQLKLLPGLTLAAQLIFTVVFGPLGLLLALPLAVCLQVIVREILIHDILDPWKQRQSA